MEKVTTQDITTNKLIIDIEKEFNDFIPKDFKHNPLAYFEKYGRNIKPGEPHLDNHGQLEDPTAVKDLPVWKNKDGKTLNTVGKKINIEKLKRLVSEDPFHEYTILELAQRFGLPSAEPIAKIKQNNSHLIIMSRITGYRWQSESDQQLLRNQGFTEEDFIRLNSDIEKHIKTLQKRFEEVGIIRRKWSPKDMVSQIDLKTKKLISITPVNWERTDINWDIVNSRT